MYAKPCRPASYTCSGWSSHSLCLTQVLRMTGIYVFGLAVTMIFTGSGKVFSGELRPNFFKLCRPNVTNCKPGQYITEYTCTNGVSASELMDVFRGFPSLHAACSAYSMMFVALYIQARLHITFCTLLKPLIQAAGIAVAFYFALTRVSDYKHHWFDCACGSLLGVIVAFYTAFRVANLFTVKQIPTTSTMASFSDSECEEREQFLEQTTSMTSSHTPRTGGAADADDETRRPLMRGRRDVDKNR